MSPNSYLVSEEMWRGSKKEIRRGREGERRVREGRIKGEKERKGQRASVHHLSLGWAHSGFSEEYSRPI